MEGCRPERGRARTELFISGSEPAASCPAGKPEIIERGFFARLGDWSSSTWRRLTHWVTRHFGTEEPQPAPRERDYLGAPRLPRAVEAIEDPRVAPVPLGVPVPIIIPDTAVDTLRIDSIRRDTMRFRPDTARVRPDTLIGLF
jgi:hypothetical protein